MSRDFEEFEDLDYEEEKERHPIRTTFFSIILLCILCVIYARYIGTSGLFVKEYKIKSNEITDTINGFTIVHFSDFHYGRTTHLDELKKLVNAINKTKPDIIIFSGDLIDKDTKINDNEMASIIEELKKLDSTYGNYYVNGNHDNKYDKYNQMMDSANFMDLNNNYDVIYNVNNETILLSGLSTKADTKFLEEVFNGKTYNYKINVMHYPDDIKLIKDYNYNLVLSGHSHNGQIRVPLYGAIITPNHAKKYYKPYYRVNNTKFYISSGIGVSDYNFRFLNRPSYNVYRLTNK